MKIISKNIAFSTTWILWCLLSMILGAGTNSAFAAPVSSEVENHKLAQNDWRGLVELLASNPKILTMKWPQIRKLLPADCISKPNDTELSCPSIDGLVSISVTPGPTGVVDLILKPPVTCELLYYLLNKHLGKGKLENGDMCDAEWSLNHWVKKSYATVRSSRKDKNIVFLQFGTEQGP
jgi:hypothetical protein